MKTWALFVFLMMVAVLPLSASPTTSGFSVASPDHPPIWFNRSGDKVSQELSWDKARRELVLYVSYDTIQNWVTNDQWYYDNFKLSFPDVRLNESTGSLYFMDQHGRHITLGHIEDGAFGRHVVLDDDVQLVVNRHDDAIHASISSADGHAKKPISR
jgi:hypothetical protein